MNAIAEMEKHFDEHYPGALFIERLALFLKHAYVISSPNLFAMFRPVRSDAPAEAIGDPAHEFAGPDAWYIDQLAGTQPLDQLVHQLPFPLPKICFYRNEQPRLHIYWTDQLAAQLRRRAA